MADDIGLAAYEHIQAVADVTALTDRGFVGELPQGTDLPAYVVDVVSNNAVEGIGTSALSTARVRVKAYDDTRAGATLLAETIRIKAMRANFRGLMGSTQQLLVREITLASGPHWERYFPRDGSDEWLPETRIDYLVWHVQTAPS